MQIKFSHIIMGISNYENVKWKCIAQVKKQLGCKVYIYEVTQ